jgi:hypothetical protein
MGRSLVIEIEGVLDRDTPLAAVLEIGQRVDVAVRAAVPHVREVRWSPDGSPASRAGRRSCRFAHTLHDGESLTR